MLLVDKLKVRLNGDTFTPIALHFLLAFGVAAYTIFGALIMQYLESPPIADRGNRESRQIHTIRENNKQDKGSIVSYPFTSTRVFLGTELGSLDPEVHKCVERELARLMSHKRNCEDLEKAVITPIDLCYQMANFSAALALDLLPDTEETTDAPAVKSKEELIEEEVQEIINKWSFENAIIFAFTVITTIGYGHVAPETFYGRLFVIFYGLIGVPITLLTIADMGMFISMILRKVTLFLRSLPLLCRRAYKTILRKAKTPRDIVAETKKMNGNGNSTGVQEEEEEMETEETTQRKSDESILLCILFIAYLMFGAKVLSSYEPDMHFFEAFYFNFVTLTTIGLGDFVPKSYDYLFVTLCYIGIGLALTTMSVEIAADMLKKLHYFGRKIDNVQSTMVWFGGKKMTVKALMKHLGDQLNIPEEELAKFDLTQFIGDAIAVEAGTKETLRKAQSPDVRIRDHRAVSYSELRHSDDTVALRFVDERTARRLIGPDGVPLADETARTVTSTNRRLRMVDDVTPHSSARQYHERKLPKLSFGPSIQTNTPSVFSYDEDYAAIKTPSIHPSR